jgi:hypothetical protein
MKPPAPSGGKIACRQRIFADGGNKANLLFAFDEAQLTDYGF